MAFVCKTYDSRFDTPESHTVCFDINGFNFRHGDAVVIKFVKSPKQIGKTTLILGRLVCWVSSLCQARHFLLALFCVFTVLVVTSICTVLNLQPEQMYIHAWSKNWYCNMNDVKEQDMPATCDLNVCLAQNANHKSIVKIYNMPQMI